MRSTHNGGHDYLPSSAMTAAPRSPTAVIDALNDEGKAPGHVNEGKAPGHVNSSGVVGKEIGEVRFSTVDHSGKGRLMDEKFLSRSDVKSFYDRLGIGQDWQRFYEGAAIRALCDNGKFTTTDAILELGCGTGAFALDLFQHYLPPTAWYLGLDISSTMVDLARERLAGFGRRAQVWLTDGALTFPFRAASFDRWVANYVLDLLPPDDIRQVLAEAHRLLKPEGYLCLVSLTQGRTLPAQAITGAWTRVHRLNPALVGGCRPLSLLPFLAADQWCVCYHDVTEAFGLASEVVVASKARP